MKLRISNERHFRCRDCKTEKEEETCRTECKSKKKKISRYIACFIFSYKYMCLSALLCSFQRFRNENIRVQLRELDRSVNNTYSIAPYTVKRIIIILCGVFQFKS